MILAIFVVSLEVTLSHAHIETFQLNLSEAEKIALHHSNRLKSSLFDQIAAEEQAQAQRTTLLPKLNFQASYQYYANIPEISLSLGPPIPFGTHSTYIIGPNLTYTFWDSYSGRKAYQASRLLVQAREEDKKNTERQVLLSLRSAYLQTQLGLQELQLIHDSLELAQAQSRDISTRFRAGAASRLDVVISQRTVLNYEIQFKQRQALLSSTLKDLLMLLGQQEIPNISHPGPPSVPHVSLVLKLDSLTQLIADQERSEIRPPNDHQPQILSQNLQAESLELNSESQAAKRYPNLQVSGGLSYNRPNIPNPISFWQETIGIALSVPLFLGDPTPYLVAQQRNQAQAVRHRAAQLKEDLHRDFLKAKGLLESYREQRKLAVQDVVQSEEAAKLYYVSYKAGKINYTDVQNANLQALQSKVNVARIDAQILNQIILLKSISGKEIPCD